MIKVLVDQLEQEPLKVHLDCSAKQLELADDPIHHFEGPVTGDLEFKVFGRDVRATGALDCDTWTECARCLRRVDHHCHVPVDATWLWHDPTAIGYEEPTGDAILAEYYTGHEFEADEVLRELILAELPEVLYCKPDCKGLCAGCGADLNTEPCTCKPKPDDEEPLGETSWKAAIKKLKA